MEKELEFHFILVEVLKQLKRRKKKVNIPIEREAKVKVEYTPAGIQVAVIKSPISEMFLVTSVQALQHHELPGIYVDELDGIQFPTVWQERNRLITGDGDVLLQVGEMYSYGELKKALLYIELAGRHLAVANQHVKSGFPKWTKCDRITFKDGLLLSTRGMS